jgi:hypothetical protein
MTRPRAAKSTPGRTARDGAILDPLCWLMRSSYGWSSTSNTARKPGDHPSPLDRRTYRRGAVAVQVNARARGIFPRAGQDFMNRGQLRQTSEFSSPNLNGSKCPTKQERSANSRFLGILGRHRWLARILAFWLHLARFARALHTAIKKGRGAHTFSRPACLRYRGAGRPSGGHAAGWSLGRLGWHQGQVPRCHRRSAAQPSRGRGHRSAARHVPCRRRVHSGLRRAGTHHSPGWQPPPECRGGRAVPCRRLVDQFQ